MTKINKTLNVYGMHCKSCEKSIENEVKSLNGIISVHASHSSSKVKVVYDNELCSESEILSAIEIAGYSTSKESNYNKFLGLSLLVLAMIILGKYSFFNFDTNLMLENASFAMLFIVGILTSLHCVGMCGGIMLTQTIDKDNLISDRKSSFKVSLKYNLGRVLSYTILGGIIGSIGSVFSLSMKMQGYIQLFAAIFMILTGLKMFGIKILSTFKFSIPLFKGKCNKNGKNPFLIGLLNGFMPCGPLQTMQLYALGTGSFILGALSMFIFALGTLPLMLGFGFISSMLSRKFSNKIFKYSGVFIILLGLSMGQRGLALSGFNIPSFNYSSQASGDLPEVIDGYQNVTLTVDRYGYKPSTNVIKGDIPLRLTIDVKELTSCNSAMYFPEFDQCIDLNNGNIVIEINTSGKDLSFTCWMGMLRGKIKAI